MTRMTSAEYARHRAVSRAAVGKAIKTGQLDGSVIGFTTRGRGRVPFIKDVNQADLLWESRPQSKPIVEAKAPEAAQAAGATGPATKSERAAEVDRELGPLGHDDRASNIAEAKKQLVEHRSVLAAVAKAKKAGRLDAELEKQGKWVRLARRSLTYAKVIARKRTLSDLDVEYIEAFINEALCMLLGDPEPTLEEELP